MFLLRIFYHQGVQTKNTFLYTFILITRPFTMFRENLAALCFFFSVYGRQTRDVLVVGKKKKKDNFTTMKKIHHTRSTGSRSPNNKTIAVAA